MQTNYLFLTLIISIICFQNLFSQKVSIDESIIVGAVDFPVDNVPINGSLLFFDVTKSAFRAGSISSSTDFWAPSNIGSYSFAANRNTIASGLYATALGNRTVSSGQRTISAGYYSNAIGHISFAFGERLNADARNVFTVGRYNLGGGNSFSWSLTDPIFEVGIGTSENARANALTILKSGAVSFQNYSFPNLDGMANQALVTDGNGQINWQTQSGSGGGAFEEINNVIKPSLGVDKDFIIGHDSLPGISENLDKKILMFDHERGAFRTGNALGNDWSTAKTGLFTSAFGVGTLAKSYGSTAVGLYNTGFGLLNEPSINNTVFEVGIGFADNDRKNGLTVYKTGKVAFHNYYFPINNGATNQVLKANANGGLTWAYEDPGLGAYRLTGNTLHPINNGQYNFVVGDTQLPPNGNNAFRRLMFYDDIKGAFRMGLTTNAGWSPTQLGELSSGFGLNTSAKGTASSAFGVTTNADSYSSFAIGRNNWGGGNATQWDPADPLFEVGIGASDFVLKNALTVLKNGNVGINTHEPEAILDVRGKSFIKMNSGSIGNVQLELFEDEIDYSRLQFTNAGGTARPWIIAARSNGANTNQINFNIYNEGFGDVLSLHGDGRVYLPHRLGIGNDLTPDAALDIAADAGEDPLHLRSGNLDLMRVYENGKITLGGTNSAGSAGNVFIQNKLGMGEDNPTFRLHIVNSTLFSVGQARAFAWTTYSDKRVKKNIQPIEYGLKEILELKPVKYDHYGSTFENDSLIIKDDFAHEIGFIAQEMYEVVGEIVQKPADENTDLWSLNYEKLTPVLVKAIQEQQAQIDQLTQQNTLLISQLNEMNQKMIGQLAELNIKFADLKMD